MGKKPFGIVYDFDYELIKGKGMERLHELYDKGFLDTLEPGAFETLRFIHKYIYGDHFPYAGKIREFEAASSAFQIAPRRNVTLLIQEIEQMPHSTSDEIVDKFLKMNHAMPFTDKNEICISIWANIMFKRNLNKIVDWTLIEGKKYQDAMRRCFQDDRAIKNLISGALTDDVDNKELYIEGLERQLAQGTLV